MSISANKKEMLKYLSGPQASCGMKAPTGFDCFPTPPPTSTEWQIRWGRWKQFDHLSFVPNSFFYPSVSDSNLYPIKMTRVFHDGWDGCLFMEFFLFWHIFSINICLTCWFIRHSLQATNSEFRSDVIPWDFWAESCITEKIRFSSGAA